MKKLVMELTNCACYGYMAYIENESDIKVIDFLNEFSMWGGRTNSYNNYGMYELPKETVAFINTDRFRDWLTKHDVELITSDNEKFRETLIKEVFEHN